MLIWACIPIVISSYMVVGYYLLLAPGNLYNALVSEDWGLFMSVMTRFFFLATAVLGIKILRGFLRETGANLLRSRLTHRLHEMYFGSPEEEDHFSAPPYYKVVFDYRIDNPDQRIVADAREFCTGLFDILVGGGTQGADSGGVIEAVASVALYTRQTYLRTGWFGIISAYAWSGVVAAVTVFVINRTSPVLYTQERLEGDLRYAHGQLRRHAEEVAFLRGGPFEKHVVDTFLNAAINNRWVVITRHVWLNGLQYGFGYYISIVMYVTLAAAIRTKVFEGYAGFPVEGTAGDKARWISQSGSVFLQLLYAFTMLVQLGTSVSAFVASAGRLDGLVAALNQGSTQDSSPSDIVSIVDVDGFNDDTRPLIGVSHATETTITADHLIIKRPGGPCIGPVTFTLRPGGSVLLRGPTGCGKTSVLRATRGLWSTMSGTVTTPLNGAKVMFAPQRTYIPTGVRSLRELVLYPHICTSTTNETTRIVEALRTVGWRSGLHERDLDNRDNWATRLSPGEAQLISAARIVYAAPTFAFLDEPTAGLDENAAIGVLGALREANIATFVVGHSDILLETQSDVVMLGESYADS